MQYNFLDIEKTIQVSKICLGTMTWGYQNTEAEAHEQLEYALSRGINFIDTAEVYAVPPSEKTYGKTENFIGTWLAKNLHNRAKIIIATKMVGPGQTYIRGGDGIQAIEVESAINGSLKRLQTDYIDLYQIHWPQRKVNYFGQYNYDPTVYDEQVTIKEIENIHQTMEALNKAVQKGKIRNIGVSNETPWGIFQFKYLAKQYGFKNIISIQNPYNLVNRSFDLNLSEVCMKEKVGLLAYSPLAGGLLTGKYRNGQRPNGARFSTWGFKRMDRYSSPTVFAAIEEYATIAEDNGLTPSQLSLAFVNSKPFLTANIIGATSMYQLKEDIASISIKLSPDIYEKIENVFEKYRNPAA